MHAAYRVHGTLRSRSLFKPRYSEHVSCLHWKPRSSASAALGGDSVQKPAKKFVYGIGEDGTAGCLACNKYAVLPPCGRHGRLPANLTVSFIARKWIDLNNWRQAIIVRPIIPTTVEENVQDYHFFQIYKVEKEVGNMPNMIEKE